MKQNNKILFGTILILLGLYFIGRELGLYSFDTILPFIFIAIGVWLIVRRRNHELKSEQQTFEQNEQQDSRFGDPSSSDPESFASQQSEQDTNYSYHSSEPNYSQKKASINSQEYEEVNGKIKYNKFIGDMVIDLNERSLQDIEVSTFIGDTDILVQGAILSKGLNRIIVSGFIGDSKIFVPKDMAVFVNTSNFIGSIEACGRKSSSLGNNIECQSENYNSSENKVYIAVNCFIGDIKIVSV